MRKETLEKKLNRLKEKLKAYDDVEKYLYDLLEEEEKSADYKDAVRGVLKVVANFALMVRISIRRWANA